jgi:hypothetical protein
MQENYQKWSLYSVVALLLVGTGFSITGNAIIAKSRGRGWFWQGTLGLIVFNAGLAVLGEAVKTRALYETELNSYKRDA